MVKEILKFQYVCPACRCFTGIDCKETSTGHLSPVIGFEVWESYGSQMPEIIIGGNEPEQYKSEVYVCRNCGEAVKDSEGNDVTDSMDLFRVLADNKRFIQKRTKESIKREKQIYGYLNNQERVK